MTASEITETSDREAGHQAPASRVYRSKGGDEILRSLRSRVWHVMRLSAAPAGIFLVSRLSVLLVVGAIAFDLHRSVTWVLYRWDSGWYVRAAQQGYPDHLSHGTGAAAQNTLGFFPLLPMTIRGTVHLTGLSYRHAGLLVAFLGGLVGAILLWWLLRDITGKAGANQGTALVFFSPAAFVLSMIYTESLLLPLASGALLALHRRKWLTAGILSGIATAADPRASAIIVACAVAAGLAIYDRREWRALLAPLLAPVGLVAFCSYLWVHTGNPLASFIENKRGWQRGHLGHAIISEVSNTIHGAYAPNSIFPLAGLALGLLLLFFFIKGHPTAPVLAYVIAVLVIAFPSPVIGYSPRVLLGAFPLFGIVGARLPRPWFDAVLGLSATTMAALAFVTLGTTAYVL